MRNGIQQHRAHAFGFREKFGLRLRVTQPLAVEHQRNLPDEGVEQIALRGRQRRRVVKPQTQHAGRARARDERQMQSFAGRQIVRATSRRLPVLKRPRRDGLLLVGQRPSAGEISR